MGKQQPASYYDAAYRESEAYARDAHDAPWSCLWRFVADRIPDAVSVVDIGCGPGHMADHLADRVLYTGLDFSEVAIDQARALRPKRALFVWADAQVDPWPRGDVYLFLEILEHIEHDIDLLRRVPIGKRIIVSVPNFDSEGHVRHFTSAQEAADRYQVAMNVEKAATLAPGAGRSRWFVLEGTRR